MSFHSFFSLSLIVYFVCQAFPVLLGDIDTSGSLNAQVIHQLTDRIRGKMVVQVRFTSLTISICALTL